MCCAFVQEGVKMVQGSLPLHWRKYPERYRLEGNINEQTGQEFFEGLKDNNPGLSHEFLSICLFRQTALLSQVPCG